MSIEQKAKKTGRQKYNQKAKPKFGLQGSSIEVKIIQLPSSNTTSCTSAATTIRKTKEHVPINNVLNSTQITYAEQIKTARGLSK